MKSSMFVVAGSAVLAAAGPLKMRALSTEWVTEVVTVTVTAGDSAPTPGNFVESHKSSYTPSPKGNNKPPTWNPGFNYPGSNYDDYPDYPNYPNYPDYPDYPPVQSNSPPPPKPTNNPSPPKPSVAPMEPQTSTSAAPPATTSANPPASPPAGSGSYADKMVQIHNQHRATHQVGNLQWDQSLVDSATTIAKGCVFQHQMDVNGGGYGQNLASASTRGGDETQEQIDFGVQAVDEMWYKGEVGSYEGLYQSGPGSAPLSDYGHFTQVVWKGTSRVGCATVKCAAGTIFGMESWYTVCNYKAPGNVQGQYPENVFPPKN